MMLRCAIGVVVLALSGGCATRVAPPEPGLRSPVTFQSVALAPGNGGQLVAASELRPGDIVLSAAGGVTSVGIRLLTLAPVSHAALYVGEGRVAEAVGEGVVLRDVSDMLAQEAMVVAFRHPGVGEHHAQRLRAFVQAQLGRRYNHVGVLLHAPFSVERRACELPLMPDALREACLLGVATVQLGAVRNDRFFCSQFVIEAYRQAGLPITDADPRWISPADILHMREGDVPSVRVHQALLYVGHLKAMAPLEAAEH